MTVFMFVVLPLLILYTIFIYRIMQEAKINEKSSVNNFILLNYNHNIINVSEIENIVKRYNVNEDSFEIVYTLCSSNEIIESFDSESSCNDRFYDIYYLINQ